MSDGTKLDMKTLVGCRNHLPIRSLHRTFHRSGEVGNGAGPVALRNFHFVRMVNEVIVRKSFEEFDRLRFMVCPSPRRFGLPRPKDGGVGRMTLFEGLPVLSIPSIVKGSHEFEVAFCHNGTPFVRSEFGFDWRCTLDVYFNGKNIYVSDKRVARLMREHNIQRARRRPNYRKKLVVETRVGGGFLRRVDVDIMIDKHMKIFGRGNGDVFAANEIVGKKPKRAKQNVG